MRGHAARRRPGQPSGHAHGKYGQSPAIPYGGKYRIIDFPLSNCTNSGVDVVGVLTQYQPLKLNAYIGSGSPWDLDLAHGGVYVLPPYVKGKSGEWYSGTANAIYQNLAFIEQFNTDYVLILSGDHIYKMDYNAMLQFHIDNKADCTIAVREVPWEEASRFGIMNTGEGNAIEEFEEKPAKPRSNKASMGVYIFTWEKLRKYLTEDAADPASSNDFGKNIIPNMLRDNQRMYAYDFEGYWKDVGTIESLWEANMDLLQLPMPIDLYDKKWRIYGRNPGMAPHFIAGRRHCQKQPDYRGLRSIRQCGSQRALCRRNRKGRRQRDRQRAHAGRGGGARRAGAPGHRCRGRGNRRGRDRGRRNGQHRRRRSAGEPAGRFHGQGWGTARGVTHQEQRK